MDSRKGSGGVLTSLLLRWLTTRNGRGGHWGSKATSNDKRHVNTMLNKVLEYVEHERSILVLDMEMEII